MLVGSLLSSSVCIVFYFFFFKQKTAYEMRISDWSSTCALPIWIEAALGRVVEFGPLPGWRPAWNASVETPAGIMGVHIRGDRDAGQEMQPLRREYDVLCLLESEGIPVPKKYGWCDDQGAIVMEREIGRRS